MTKRELNDKLAELYGITAYSPIHGLPDTEGYVPISVNLLIDDSARVFELAITHDIWIEPYNNLGFIYVHYRCNHDVKKILYEDHESPQASARYAIALALIKLKGDVAC